MIWESKCVMHTTNSNTCKLYYIYIYNIYNYFILHVCNNIHANCVGVNPKKGLTLCYRLRTAQRPKIEKGLSARNQI